MILRLICFILVLAPCLAASAQKKKKNAKDEAKSTSVAPYYPSQEYGPKVSKKKKRNKAWETTYNARNDFYDRMEKNWKEREKREKNVSGELAPDKLQPPYFGHKRPPKKRPAGKMKYCKVCGIKH